MSQVHLKYVEQWLDRHGKPRCYFRRGHGKRIRLPGRPGSPEFILAYQRALDASSAEPPPQRHRGPTGTFDRLVEDYYSSTNYLSVAPETQVDYRHLIEALLREEKIGHRQVAQMTSDNVDAIVARRLKNPGKAVRTLSVLRILLDFAVNRGWRDSNPAANITKIKLGTIHTWTEEELQQYVRRWPVGTVERTAFDLLLYTGQRSGDVRHMTWGALESDLIRLTQRKTGKNLLIPILPDLRQSLAAVTRGGQLLILTHSGGRSFSDSQFSVMMRKAIAAAGLPKRCVPHGLRKAAATRLADAGCSSKEIQAITGHQSLSEVERYTKAADQKALARSALDRLVRHRTNKDSQT